MSPWDPTVARLTWHSVLGRRRALVLLLLPVALLALCALARALAALEGGDAEVSDALAVDLLAGFGLGVLMPLLGLIAGTGVIGPEIDEGSIVYLLTKPIDRFTIVLTKLGVAVAVVLLLGVLPVAASGLVLTGELDLVTAGFTVGALSGGLAYCALFLLLAVVTRHAVVVGLIYALVWESVVGQFVPGVQNLSAQQWSLATVVGVFGDDAERLELSAAVGPATGWVLLVVVAVGSTVYAGLRLRRLRLGAEV
ncbi:ABC transporter permease subunit [Nocardioides caldifontis]|uniref:ABC transporter permease subunit n=1 Tax=Nocardioides caldifontis TaxID=2588938 RepID=UPI0011DFC464|nr:ABC transporter permease subunit [Nocardioides caldifontis]